MSNLFICSVRKYLLSTYCVLSTVLGIQNPSVNKQQETPTFVYPTCSQEGEKKFKEAILKFMLIGVKRKKKKVNMAPLHSQRCKCFIIPGID